MQRYGVVLQELRLEVLRNNNYLASVSAIRSGETPAHGESVSAQRQLLRNPRESGSRGRHYGDLESGDNFASRTHQEQDLADAIGGGQSAGNMTSNPEASMNVLDGGFFHITNWGQFDSLVSNAIYHFMVI